MSRYGARTTHREQIDYAKQKAQAARAGGLTWWVEHLDIKVDVTILAHIELQTSAQKWIETCIRSVKRVHSHRNSADRKALRKKLWAFWRGD